MKKITGVLLVLIMMAGTVMPCQAAEKTIRKEERSIDINVYARYNKEMEQTSIPVVNGSAEILVDNHYVISVTGVPEDVVILRIVSIPSSETDAWDWITKCIGTDVEIMSIFDIWFEDKEGNRVNADQVKITISNVEFEAVVFSVTTDGKVLKVDSAIADKRITFTTNGSRYYVLAEEVLGDLETDIEVDNKSDLCIWFIGGILLMVTVVGIIVWRNKKTKIERNLSQ